VAIACTIVVAAFTVRLVYEVQFENEMIRVVTALHPKCSGFSQAMLKMKKKKVRSNMMNMGLNNLLCEEN